MKPFDLEAAKRGEPILVEYKGDWAPAHFVGLDRHGFPVIDGESDCSPSNWSREKLRMAPKMRTIFVNVYQMRHESRDAYQACAFNERASAIHDSTVNAAKFHIIAAPIEIEE